MGLSKRLSRVLQNVTTSGHLLQGTEVQAANMSSPHIMRQDVCAQATTESHANSG